MAQHQQEIAMLAILLAASERGLEAFQAADNLVDSAFITDLERIIARTRAELDAVVKDRSERGLREAGT